MRGWKIAYASAPFGKQRERFEIQLERVQGAPVSNEEILTDIRHAATLAGTNVISQQLYSKLGKFGATTPSRRFGTWNRAVIAAGLEAANEINIADARLFEIWLVRGIRG